MKTVKTDLYSEPKVFAQVVCLTHSEAKRTEMSEIGADKGLLEGHEGKLVVHALKEKKE